MHTDLLEAIANVERTKVSLAKAETKLAVTKAELTQKKADMERMLELSVLDEKIRFCEAKAYWVDVAEAETLLAELQHKVSDASQQMSTALEAVHQHEATAADVSGISHVTAEITRVGEEMEAVQREAQKSQTDYKRSQVDLAQLTNRLKGFKAKKVEYAQQLANAREQLQEMRARALDTAADREREVIRLIEDCAQQLQAAQADEKAQLAARFEAEATKEEASKRFNEWQKVERNIQGHVRRLQTELEELRRSDGDALRRRLLQIDGKRMLDVWTEIQKVPALRNCVIGPIGSLLTLDPRYRDFELAVEISLWPHSTAFINTSNSMHITHQVLDIFKRMHVRYDIHSQPISARYAVPAIDGAPTVLNALVFEGSTGVDQVFNCLVDRVGIEKRLLIEKESDARAFVHFVNGSEVYRNLAIKDMICKNGTVVSWRKGVRSSAPQKNPQLRHYLGGNADEALYSKEQEIEALSNQLREHTRIRPVSDDRSRGAEQIILAAIAAVESAVRRSRTAAKNKKVLETELAEMQEAKAQHLDTSKIEEEEKELKLAQREASDKIEAAERELEEARRVGQELKDSKERNEQRKLELESELQTLQKALDKAVRSVDAYKMQLAKLQMVHDKQIKIHAAVQAEQQKQQLARDTCEQLAREKSQQNVKDWDHNPLPISRSDTKKKLEAEARKYQEQLEAGRREQGLSGVTLQIATERFRKAKEAFKEQKENYLLITKNCEDFGKDTEDRKVAYTQHRRENTKKVNLNFDKYLSEKGFQGKCQINHADSGGKPSLVLETRVSQDDGDQGKCTDVRQLSGGERSYITLALLLALGYVIDTPFRVMDEYDVFLDEVSRTTTLKLLQDYANSSQNKGRQFIIITPHRLDNIVTTPNCQIVRMKDPERRTATGLQQQTLNVTRN